ncbi:MAG: GatB/YqeY domain-containing protein [Aminivibrio sp.]|nr:GatB/YqeY domain-containing protein [Aminivibrio sp.]
MIDLEKRISADLLAAMKEKKKMELSSLRMLKAEFQRARTEKGHAGELSEDEVISLVQRLVKQRREAADQYTAVGAGDRAARELKEALFLETYLPEQLSDEELGQIVEEAGAFAKAAGPKDMGRVMGRVMTAVKGRADGKRVKARVQEYLQSLVG